MRYRVQLKVTEVTTVSKLVEAATADEAASLLESAWREDRGGLADRVVGVSIELLPERGRTTANTQHGHGSAEGQR